MSNTRFIYCLILTFILCVVLSALAAPEKLGTSPTSEWACPSTHPIKGNFTTYSGEPCIAHPPRGVYYQRTKPERCYASMDEAKLAGCRPSSR